MESGLKFSLLIIALFISSFTFAQSDSATLLRQIDSILDAGGNPTFFIHQHDSITKLNAPQQALNVDSLKKDSTAITSPLDSLKKKKRRGKVAITAGIAINPVPNNFNYSYFNNTDKTSNAFLNFNLSPQISAAYIYKGNFIGSVEGWAQTGTNLINNLDSGYKTTITHVSVSIMHLVAAKTTDKYTIAPYSGLKFLYSFSSMTYLIHYDALDSTFIPPHLYSRKFSYTEKTKLYMLEVPVGVTFMSKKFIADLGESFNVFGNVSGIWSAKDGKAVGNYAYLNSGTYSKQLIIGKNMSYKYLFGNVVLKAGYLIEKRRIKKTIYEDE